MADNTVLNAGTGGDTISTDDIGGVKVQRVKVQFGADGAAADVSAAAPLPTIGDVGVVSTANSSAVPLAANAVFTGTSEDLTHYPFISVYVYSDQASAADGLSIQQSSDGTNWDVTDAYTTPAATGKTYSVGRTARYFRIVFANGTAAQGVLRLQTIFSRVAGKDSSVRPQDGRTNESDMVEGLAYGMGFNGLTWDRLRIKPANTAASFADPALVVDVRPNAAINMPSADGENACELLKQLVIEMRILNYLIASEFRMRDDLNDMRVDPSITSLQ